MEATAGMGLGVLVGDLKGNAAMGMVVVLTVGELIACLSMVSMKVAIIERDVGVMEC